MGMAVEGASIVHPARNPRGFMNSLSSMASEWLLIFLLFVDAALSYLLTKFARYCELQTPCLLCSRLDHVFGDEKLESYRSLLCSNHRMEISSLMSCHIHGNLADARSMCDECLMSFAMHNKLNSDSYRSLVSKLGVDLDQCSFQSSSLNKNVVSVSLSTRTCSCCNKTWRARSNPQRLLHLTPIRLGSIKPNVKPPLPRFSGRVHLSRRDSFKKIRDKISGPLTPRRLGNTGVDPLSHVGYTELKITSDSDSEFPFSDDEEDRSSLIRESTDPNEVVRHSSGILPKARTEKSAPVKQTIQAYDLGHPLLDQSVQLDVSDPRDVDCSASDDVMRHGLGELTWEQVFSKPNSSSLPELISLDDVPPPSNIVEILDGSSANKFHVHLPHISGISALSELVLQNDSPPYSSVVEFPLVTSPEKYVIQTREIGHKSVIKPAEVAELTSEKVETDCGTYQVLLDDKPRKMSNDVDQSAESKLAGIDNGREVSRPVAELSVRSDFARIHDHVLPAHGIGPSANETISGVHGHHDELQRSESSNGIRALQKSASYESLDGSSVSEIEGESITDRLKRQVENDRRSLSALYKELEEERNAAEIAANQAMAMITRLQEEKASLHMEALQYLRMMEEQAEYDMEALEKANDLLAEKEKEVQDLEAELEDYRINFPLETMAGCLPGENSHSQVDYMRIENNGTPRRSIANTPCDSTSTKLSDGSDQYNNIKTSSLDFEGEKLYISQCLKKLERKLHQVSSNGAIADLTRNGYAEKVADGVCMPMMSLTNGETQTGHHKEENGFLVPRDPSPYNDSLSPLEGSDASVEDNVYVFKQNNHFDSDWQEPSIHVGENNLIALKHELSDLNGRLEALETSRDFLEHTFNSLRNGNEGLRFVKEIASQLQELRKRCLYVV